MPLNTKGLKKLPKGYWTLLCGSDTEVACVVPLFHICLCGNKEYKSIVKWYINRTKTEFGSGNEYFDVFRHRKCISSFLLRFGDVENESTT